MLNICSTFSPRSMQLHCAYKALKMQSHHAILLSQFPSPCVLFCLFLSKDKLKNGIRRGFVYCLRTVTRAENASPGESGKRPTILPGYGVAKILAPKHRTLVQENVI